MYISKFRIYVCRWWWNNDRCSLFRFSHSTSNALEVLLDWNYCVACSTTVFTDQNQWETLSLSRNRLTFIPNDTFDDLNRLKYLSLSLNALTAVPNLKAQTNLKELYLFENSIESLLASDFEKKKKMKSLSYWIVLQ